MNTVLIDASHIGAFCGFGEVTRQYIHCLTQAEIPDIHFIFLLPEKYKGAFGDRFGYISVENKLEELRDLKENIDLWHATNQLFKYRMRGKNTMQLLTVHDLNFLEEKQGIHRLKRIYKLGWRIRRSDCVTVISNYVKQDLLSHVNTGGKEVEVIYNGIADLEKEERKRPPFISDDREKFLFTIGQVCRKKNFHTLVPMMKYLPEYKLYIVGDHHFDYAEELREAIRAYGDNRVFLVGKISDSEKNWLYEHCTGFLFPSKLEGFGIPVLEAMRFKCKVFSSKFTSLPEIGNKYASYWDSYEPQDMAEVVKKGIDAWDKHSDFANEMKAYSLGFNYQKYTAAYLALYRKMLAERKRR